MKNEEIILPLWLSYYMRHFDPQDVYVTSDNSTDHTVKLLERARVNVSDVALGGEEQTKHSDIVKHVKDRVTQLLETYQTVLYAEVDEFMVPFSGSLRPFLESWAGEVQNHTCKKKHKCSHRYTAVNTLDIIQDVDNEKPLDMFAPIMAQRKYALKIPKFNNAMLWAIPPRWDPSFHRVDDVQTEASNTLYMLHLHHIDFDLCNSRHKARQAHFNPEVFSAEVDDDLREFFRKKFDKPEQCYSGAKRIQIPESMSIITAF